MSTSDIKKSNGKTFTVYLSLSVFLAVFAVIYECFSHGVFSAYMILCFAPPLLLGALPFFIIFLTEKGMPGRISFNLYNSFIAALTAGLVFKGVIEIYGTTNRLSAVYFIAAGLFFALSAIFFIYDKIKAKKRLAKQ